MPNKKIPKEKKVDFVKFDVDDGSPTKPEERREYCAKVAGFYSDIFKKKLESLIAGQMQALVSPHNTAEYDLLVKANINAFSILLDWGDDLLAELKEKPEGDT